MSQGICTIVTMQNKDMETSPLRNRIMRIGSAGDSSAAVTHLAETPG